MKKKFFMILWGFSTIFGASCSNGTDETNETKYTVFRSVGNDFSHAQNSPHKMMMDEDGEFYWNKNDRLFVYDKRLSTYTKTIASRSSDITGKQKLATFIFDGDFTDDSYPVFYTNTSSSYANGWAITHITHQQNQSQPNYSEFLGNYGACGVDFATRQPDGTFVFKLQHKAAYLKLFPYLGNGPTNAKLKNIWISAKDNKIIRGYFQFNVLTGEWRLSTDANHNYGNTIQANCADFSLTSDKDKALENAGCYFVIAPGEYELAITYIVEYLKNGSLSSKTFQRTVSLRNYPVATYTNIRHKLMFDGTGFDGDAGEVEVGDASEIESKGFAFE